MSGTVLDALCYAGRMVTPAYSLLLSCSDIIIVAALLYHSITKWKTMLPNCTYLSLRLNAKAAASNVQELGRLGSPESQGARERIEQSLKSVKVYSEPFNDGVCSSLGACGH